MKERKEGHEREEGGASKEEGRAWKTHQKRKSEIKAIRAAKSMTYTPLP